MSSTSDEPALKELNSEITAQSAVIAATPSFASVVYPLSHGQQAIWLASQLSPESANYNIAVGAHIRASLDIPAVRRAMQRVADRHAVLRTTYEVLDGKPVQRVHEHLPIEILELEAAGYDDAQVDQLLDQMRRRPFDLINGPMVRVGLFKRATGHYVALLVVHHIAADGWSMRIILDEFRAFYTAELGAPLSVNPIKAHYTDFVTWQRDMLAGVEGQRLWDYWCKQVPDPAPVLNLPLDRPRQVGQPYRPQLQKISLAAELTADLKALAKTERTTLFTVMMAAFQVLLHRYSGQHDFLIGIPSAARGRAEFRRTVGYFVNPVPARADFSTDPAFRGLLAYTYQTLQEVLAHRDYPFPLLVKQLHPERDLTRSPLVDVLFNFQRLERFRNVADFVSPTGEATPPEAALRFEPFGLHMEEDQFDLNADLYETERSIECTLGYNANLFDAATINRLLQHYRILLESIIANPDQPVSTLPLLTEVERQYMLVDWNNSPEPSVPTDTVHQLFEMQVERTPEAIAVIDRREQLTYRELNQRANQLAHFLFEHGAEPDRPIAIALERSATALVAILAVLKAGAAYIPLDPSNPSERLAFMLADSQATLVLTQTEFVAQLPATGAKRIIVDHLWPQLASTSDTNPGVALTGDNLAYIMYTSGSTGQPKGVMITHHNLIYSTTVRLDYYRLSAPRMLLVAPLAFDSSVAGLVGTLCSGGVVCLPAPGTEHDVLQLADLIEHHRLSHWISLPSLYAALLTHAQPRQLASLTTVIVGGEACPAALVQQHAAVAPHAALFNEYGPTEATVWCTVHRCENEEPNRPVPIGRPIPGAQVFVLDAHQQPVPIGVPGELYIGGPGVARGYLNRSDLTLEKFIVDPFDAERRMADGDRPLSTVRRCLYKTGDLVRYRADGNLEFLGRVDQQVKIRGYRIELGEIESALVQHPTLSAVAVTLWESPAGQQLAAYVVPKELPAPPTHELRAFLKERLPDFMLPASYQSLAMLPQLPNGKIDRRALPQPTMARPTLTDEFVAPRTPIEAMVASIWADVLGVECIGAHDDFFELGGHSLLVTQVVARVRDEFQIDLPLRTLFEAPTVAKFAARIEGARAGAVALEVPRVVRIDRTRPASLSFSQERMWFIDQLLPGNSAYNVSGALRISGPLNMMALRRSFQTLVQRHEVLRTTFREIDGRPAQIIASELALDVPVVDLRGLLVDEREARLQVIATDEASRPFDLSRGPLLRVSVVQLADEEWANLITLHHIITDAWSDGVMAREFIALYAAYVHGSEPVLPALAIQFADFVHWQREWFQGRVLEQQLAYWRKQLAQVPMLELPTDHPRPAVATSEGRLIVMPLSDSLLDGVTRLSRESGATPFMTLLAAFQTLLYRYTQQTDIAVGVPIANRQWVAAENLIGSFVNTLVMRTRLDGAPTFREVLARVRAVTLEAYAHQDLSFAQLVTELQPERNISHSPLFQVLFNVINVPMPTFELPGLKVKPIEIDRRGAQFDLTLTVSTIKDLREVAVDYRVDLFEDATIGRLLAQYETLLYNIVADPDQSIATLSILPEEQRRQLLFDWNDTALDYERTTLHEVFERQANRTPDAIALMDDVQRMTYRDLESRANQVAHHLRWLGVMAGTPVAISLPRSIDLIAGLLGILKAGGIYVPIDPATPPERLAFMLNDSQASIWLTRRDIAERQSDHRTRVACVDTDAEVIARQPINRASVPLPPDPVAYIMYTSGSTGTPKGVLGRHWSALNRFSWMWRTYPFATDEVCCQKTYLSFVDSVWEIFGPLLAGVPLVLIADEVLKDDRRLIQTLADYKVTRLVLVPSLLRALLYAHADLQQRLPHLKYWTSSGETLPLDLAQRFWEVLPNATLINLYGSSEVAADSTYYEVKPDAALRSVPIGRPIANTQVYVLNAQQQPVPIGVVGEIVIGGEGVARGYHNRPDLTAEKFIADPFHDAEGAIAQRSPSIVPGRLYRTGDLGRYRRDGNLEYLGRADQQVKVRGVRVELGEVEAVLKRHRQVQQAVVVARSDVPGNQQLVAYVVPTSADLTQTTLREFVKAHLSEQAQPAIYMLMDMLPLTPSGKVDRQALPKPEQNTANTTMPYVAPRDLTERQLTIIWEEVLRIRPVGVQNNFFELGGHSLLAIELFARIEDVFGRRPPLTTLFQSPTIAQLAQVLRISGWSSHWSALVPIQSGDGRQVPFFCVHGFGGGVLDYGELARKLGPDQPFYGLQARGLDGEALPHARIETMAAHYIEALQTVQPHGPFQIGGYCFGGVVAYEMARQLREQGEEVALVAIMEGYAPVEPDRHRLRSIPGAWIGFLRNIPYWLRDYIALGRDQVFGRSRMKISGVVRRLSHRPSHPDAFRVEDYVPNIRHIPDIHRKLIEIHLRAMQNYSPGQYDGQVTLFRVRGMSLFRASDPQMGWGKLARGGVEVKMIEGGHNNILVVPYVASLAEQLKACLI